jgi:hypothetical protein
VAKNVTEIFPEQVNKAFFRWIRFFANRLASRGCVTLRKSEPTKKSLNFAREASFAIPSVDILLKAYPILQSSAFSAQAINYTTICIHRTADLALSI